MGAASDWYRAAENARGSHHMTEFYQDLLGILQPVKGIVRHMNESFQTKVRIYDLSLNELPCRHSQVTGKRGGASVRSGRLWSASYQTLVLWISDCLIWCSNIAIWGVFMTLGGWRYRVPRGLATVSLCGLLCLGTMFLGGCSLLQKKPLGPSHQLRSEASGSMPAGWDDRARQIESNLGVR